MITENLPLYWKIRYKLILISTGCLFVLCLLSISNVKLASAGVGFQGSLRIGMVPIIVSMDASKDEHTLSEIMEDILAQNLMRVFWEEKRGKIEILRRGRLPVENLNLLRWEQLSPFYEGGFTHLICSELSTTAMGHALRARIVDLEIALKFNINRASKNFTAIMSSKSDFEEIETKIADLSLGLALSLGSGERDPKEKYILFYCVSPNDPTDRTLVNVSRRIALEMPYFLEELWKKESPWNHLASLNPRDFNNNCLEIRGKGDTSSSGYLDFSSYDYIVTAETVMGRDKTVEILFYVVERKASRFINIPLQVMSIPIEFERDILKRLAVNFSKEFESTLTLR